MNTLRALLVDDERLARKRLAELLTRHPEITVVGEADSVESAAAAVTRLRPDVVFLDIEMPPGNGLDLLPLLPAVPELPAIVFVTAYEAFAVQAFAVSALDYLLKPVHPERLALTVGRLCRDAERRAADALAGANEAGAGGGLSVSRAGGSGAVVAESGAPGSGSETPFDTLAPFPVKGGELTLESRITLGDRQASCAVEVGNIVVIQALGSYSRVSLRGQSAIVMLRSISEWEGLLPAGSFVRLDRSLIVQRALWRATERVSRDESLATFEGIPSKLQLGRVATLRLKKLLAGEAG